MSTIPAPGEWPDCIRGDGDPADCSDWPGIGHACDGCSYRPPIPEPGSETESETLVEIAEVVSRGGNPCHHGDRRDTDCPHYADIRYACKDCGGPTAAVDGKIKQTRSVKRRLWTPPGYNRETGQIDLTDEVKNFAYDHATWRYNTPLLDRKGRKKLLGPVIRKKETQPGLPIEMATMWTGRPGAGKTSGMVEAAYVMHLLGWKVLTNGLDLIFEDGSFNTLRELAEIITAIRDAAGERVPTCVLLDEAPFWANARRWSEFDDGFFSVIQQVRKFGLALHYSSISPMQTDVNLRRLTLWWWVCEAGWFRSFTRECWAPEEERTIGEKPKMKQRRWHRQMNHRMYDTLQLLDPTAHKLDKEAKDSVAEREAAAEKARWIAEGMKLGQPEGPVSRVIGPAAETRQQMRASPKRAKVRRGPLADRSDDSDTHDDDEGAW